MKATEAKLLDFLKKSSQFVIPIYQRTYSWTEKECRQLWDDIVRCGSSDQIGVHFVGSIVYIESGLSQVTHQSPLLVIDGQQRLTTVSLLLAALAKEVEDSEPFDGFSKRKIKNYFLLNPEESGERRFKLLLSQTDKATLTAIVGDSEQPADPSLRVAGNFQLFVNWIAEEKADLTILCKGLAKLVVVDIALNRDQDNPQLIFESMNSTGKELSQADLIRNFILMGLEPGLQTSLYESYWRPMEVDFGQEAYGSHFDSFMRHYLTVKTGEIPREREVYEAFKDYARNDCGEQTGISALVKDIREFARYFCNMALGAESESTLRDAFSDLRELKVDVAYPFLLELYHDYAERRLSSADFEVAVRLIESYVFRRAICAIPTNSMNKTFATFGKALRKDHYLESIEAHFSLLPSYRRFPSDDEFYRELRTRELYNLRIRSYWLRRLENYDRKERVSVDEYTIEHILPQNPDLSAPWRQALGSDWARIQNQWVHTLGNLTLTGYNSEYSDRPFVEKRDMLGGFKQSPLRVNAGLGELSDWNEEAIKRRADRLANQAVLVWSAPKLDEQALAQYRPATDRRDASYSIDDHPYLAVGSEMYGDVARKLFESIRRQILALDPCVYEEILKRYIAYKAETNFVDIIPQAKQLRLILNLSYTELKDPRGICRDVSNLGRWGNGDVEVHLKSEEELPYVMGLVRQAYEKQMGVGGE